MPLRNRRSSSSSRFLRTSRGGRRACHLRRGPARGTAGTRRRARASIARAASSAPPTARSPAASPSVGGPPPGRSRARSVSWRSSPSPESWRRRSCRPTARSGEILHDRRLLGQLARALPEDHRLVHPPPVQVRPDRPLELVDERVHLLVRRRPVEPAVPVSPGVLPTQRNFSVSWIKATSTPTSARPQNGSHVDPCRRVRRGRVDAWGGD